MVNGAQRLGFARVSRGSHAGGGRAGGALQQALQDAGREGRHVASGDQIPIRGRHRQGRGDTADRAASRQLVGDHGQSELAQFAGVADQSHRSCYFADNTRNMFHQRDSTKRKQSLVPSHTRASAAGQNKPGGAHERIIAFAFSRSPRIAMNKDRSGKEKLAEGGNPVIIGENKRMRFCLELVLGWMVLGTVAAIGLAAGELPRNTSPSNVAAPEAVWVVKVDSRTGRLVRTLAVARRSRAAVSADVRGLVEEAAKTFDVNPLLVDSVIQVESDYNPFAVSPKGAEGLMQLMPATAQRFGVTDSFDPKQNIEAGVRYLKFLQNTFQDDRLAIAAYNAGEKAVAKYGDVPPYPETISYVAKVGQKYGQAKRTAGQQDEKNEPGKQARTADEPKGEQEPRHILAYVDPQGKLHIATR
jgi:Transglycosylase SLT domain